MSASAKDRLAHFADLWRQKAFSFWVALASALYGAFTFWRDEFASPEQQAALRGITFLPTWPASWWTAIFFGLAMVWLFEASFRMTQADRRVVATFTDEAKNTFGFAGLDHVREMQRGFRDKMTLAMIMVLKNTSPRRVEFVVDKMALTIEGISAPSQLQSRGGIVAGLSDGKFLFPKISGLSATLDSLQGSLEYEISYGPPGHLTSKDARKMTLEFQRLRGKGKGGGYHLRWTFLDE